MDKSESGTLEGDTESFGSGEVMRWDLKALHHALEQLPRLPGPQNSRAVAGWVNPLLARLRSPELQRSAQCPESCEHGEAHVTKEEAKVLSRPLQASQPSWKGPPSRAAHPRGTPWLQSLAALRLPSPAALSLTEFYLAGFTQALPCRQLTWC